jgi:hypothetical protein
MKRIALYFVFVVLTCVTVASGAKAEQRPTVELVFCLDTTGSMGGLIEGAKLKIWSIANQIMSAKPTPEVRIGLVAYRDKEDEYVTKIVPLQDDLDAVYESLVSFNADGGGDTPEHVNRALHDALHHADWSFEARLKIIFLVGDAPPHMDYKDGYDWREICRDAVKSDIIINTVQCGDAPDTRQVWQQIARAAEGSYAHVPQSGGMHTIRTPVDDELALLSAELEATAVVYGSAEARVASEARVEAVKRMAAPAAAERAVYRSKKTEFGTSDLLDAVTRSDVELESISDEALPQGMRAMSLEERKEYLKKIEAKRAEIRKKISHLNAERQEYIRTFASQDPTADSFDQKVQAMIKTQGEMRGLWE